MATVLALSYVTETTHVARGTVLLCLLGAALLQIFTIPVVSLWSDRVGRRPVLISGALISILIAFPFFWLLDTGSVPLIFLALVLAIPVVHPFSPTARRPASSVSCSTRGCATPDPRSPTRSVECSPAAPPPSSLRP